MRVWAMVDDHISDLEIDSLTDPETKEMHLLNGKIAEVDIGECGIDSFIMYYPLMPVKIYVEGKEYKVIKFNLKDFWIS